jgi:integrase
MASRPRSRSSHPINDVRAFEEKRCFSKNALTMIIQHLHRCLETIPREKSYISEMQIWLELRDAFAFMFLFLTGLRRFEFCACTCGDVDLMNGKLFTVGKGNISDFVPLSDQAIVLLREWIDLKKAKRESITKESPLFCSTGAEGGFLSFSALRLRWKRLMRELHLPEHYGIHATRHSAGMLVFAQTGSIEKTARFLRHRDTSTTARHYLHIDIDSLRREISEIAI